MAKAQERGTMSIWLSKAKYKLFALSCKKYGFRISEIIEAMMDEFVERYPLEDPTQLEFIEPPNFVKKERVIPNVREEYEQGLLKWITIFECPICGGSKHIHKESRAMLEAKGLKPFCPLKGCNGVMEIAQ